MDDRRDYRYAYRVSPDAVIRIEFFDNKADAFYVDLPYQFQSKDPEIATERCGLNLKVTDSISDSNGVRWRDESDGKLRSLVLISRFPGGDYYQCEAHFFEK